MNQKQGIIASCVLAVTLLISGCGLGQLLGPTVTPTLMPTLTLTLAPTRLPARKIVVVGPEIHTVWGTYVITLVHHATRIPPDCDPLVVGYCTVTAGPGHHILILYLEQTMPGASPAKPGSMLSSGAYVMGNDGSQGGPVANGVLPAGEFVAFEISATAFSFTLYWPDNSPIKLNQ